MSVKRAAAEALALLALVTGQDVEPRDGSDGTDGRWQIGRNVAADGADPSASWPVLIDPRRTAPVRTDAADPHTGLGFSQHASTQRPRECASADGRLSRPAARARR